MCALLIKREEMQRLHPLDVQEEVVPNVWDGMHVGLRLTEALATLRLLPMPFDGGSGGAWPAYIYEFDDLVEQQRQGELERTQKIQNRTRISPSLNEISRMEICLWWPMQYLYLEVPHLLTAVSWVAHAHAINRDIKWVVRKRGGYADTWLDNFDKGCGLIADGLVEEKVSVF